MALRSRYPQEVRSGPCEQRTQPGDELTVEDSERGSFSGAQKVGHCEERRSAFELNIIISKLNFRKSNDHWYKDEPKISLRKF